MTAVVVIILAAVLILAAAIWAIWRPAGQPARRDTFADPDDATDPDGTQFLHALHRELPAAGRLDMLPDDPPPDDTVRIPHAHGTWGKSVTELLDDMETEWKVRNG